MPEIHNPNFIDKESLMGLVFREAKEILIDDNFDPGTGYNISSNGVVFHFVRGSTAVRIVVDGYADNYHSSNVSDVQIVPGA